MTNNWYVYIIKTRCGLHYTGISTDVSRRFAEHQERFAGVSKKGARFFNGREPLKVVYQEMHPDRSLASRREYAIKRMPLKEKRRLFAMNATSDSSGVV